MVNTRYVPNNLVGFSISPDCEISCDMDSSLRNANGLESGFDPLSIVNVPNIDLGCFSKYLQHVLSRWLVGMQSKRRQEKKHGYVGVDSTSSLPNTGALHRIVASCSFVILRFYVTSQLRSNSWHTFVFGNLVQVSRKPRRDQNMHMLVVIGIAFPLRL